MRRCLFCPMCQGQFCNHPVRNPIADTGMLALRRCHSDTEVALARLPIAIRLATSGKRYDSVDSSTRYGLFVSLCDTGYPETEFRFSGVRSGSCLLISNLTKTHARPRSISGVCDPAPN
ncbi:hypothetical protein K435DRAFT_868880 [Dendrothele bispora CBS 962.96]|uniref:Uncharacterized protein n=1 Tax=Dendrothele bispora (strain CBS 962.96) TaxID=1314807 RepID=A0A4S8LB40_DENBC|nr:hypothetical protein K435DRAFT_868880 [Dendrothele bispora CBS 962.96]